MNTRHNPLSPIELDVLEAIAQGYDNHQVATALCRSVETIRTHVVNLRLKLKARNRTHAVAMAYHLGLFAGRGDEHTRHVTDVRYPLNTRSAASSPLPAAAPDPTRPTPPRSPQPRPIKN